MLLLHAGGIREPALVRWPGRVAAGATSWALAATYDIPVTILSLAGGKLADDGRAFDGERNKDADAARSINSMSRS